VKEPNSAEQNKPEQKTQRVASHRLFLDDIEHQSFVRRLQWSPDGNFLLTPSACYYDLQSEEQASRSNYSYTVYGFLKHNMSQPAFMLPGLKTYATCIKFNPFLFEKPWAKPDQVPLFDLPYRMVFAIATTDQILVYATDQQTPIAVIGNIHYAPINDMTWYSNEVLIACSSDGYCSIMTMAKDDETNLIGKRITPEALEDETLRSHYEQLDKVDYDKLEQAVASQKKQQFMPVTFRTKTTAGK
jgi:chromatin assembly factor 1 subunit B